MLCKTNRILELCHAMSWRGHGRVACTHLAGTCGSPIRQQHDGSWWDSNHVIDEQPRLWVIVPGTMSTRFGVTEKAVHVQ
jgi:hypothetical protein